MVVDALGHVVVHAEGRRGADRLAVHVLLGGQRHAARGAGALDAEQVVVPGGQLALAPARLVDSLRDRDRGRDPVAVLGLDGPGGHCADERLLRPGLGDWLRRGCGMVPAIRGALGPGPGRRGDARDRGSARRDLLLGLPGFLGVAGLPGTRGPPVITGGARGPFRLVGRAGPGRGDEAGDRGVRGGPRGGPGRGNRLRARDGRQAGPRARMRVLLGGPRCGRAVPRRRAPGGGGPRPGAVRLHAPGLSCPTCLTRRPRGRARIGHRTVVDEANDPCRGQRPRVLVGVDREVRQRIPADGVQHPARIVRDHLDMPVEEHPVPREGCVAVSQRMPAVMSLGVLLDRDDRRRGRVRLHPHVSPAVQGPWIGTAAGHPALPAGDLGTQLQGEAGEGRARLAVVSAIDAVVLPDDRLHLGRRPGRGHLEVVAGHVDDGRAEHRIVAGCCPVWRGALDGLPQRDQVQRDAGRRAEIGRRLRDKGEPGDRSASAETYQCCHLLPPRPACRRQRFHLFHAIDTSRQIARA